MPRRKEAPGLKRGRHNLPYWMAAQILPPALYRAIRAEFPDPCIPLPPAADAAALKELCLAHTARLDAWLAQRPPPEAAATRTRYDGSVLAASRIYQEHPYSPFNATVKANTRRSYRDSLKVIETTVGRRLIRNVTVLDVRHWYEEWRKPAAAGAAERVDRAHNAVGMLKTVLRFHAALRRDDCKRLAEELEKVRFERRGAREQEMTYPQTAAFIRCALDLEARGVLPAGRGLALATGVAAQFELGIRQKDVIGEWHAAAADAERALARGAAQAIAGDGVWTGWFAWDKVPAWRWRMRTSKSKYRAPAEFDLSIYGLLFPLLERVPHSERQGAIVKGEHGLPIRYRTYVKTFRRIARAAGIPDAVWSMDARAGAATEAEEAGVPFAAVRALLGHSEKQEATTVRYLRRRDKQRAAVQQARVKTRTAESGDGG